MKFTMSKDGIERVTVRINLRFTQEELKDIKKAAELAKAKSWRGWLESHAVIGIEGDLMDCDGCYYQRYGKGEG